MAKFRVIKGGTILLALAFIVLAIVVVVVLVSAFGGDDAQPVSAQVFADAGAIIPSPYSSETSENEHTDSIASVPGDIVSRVLTASNGKKILIYHTHTHEAYIMTAANEYEPLETWRTDDNQHNIVRVGAELASLLTDMGFEVVHDTTDHEQNDLSTAYIRS